MKMEKVDPNVVRSNVINVLTGVKKLVSAYVAYVNHVEKFRNEGVYTPDHIKKETDKLTQSLLETGRSLQGPMLDSLEGMKKFLNENTKMLDMSDPELANSIALLSSGVSVSQEIHETIAGQFMGCKKALIVLSGIVPEQYKDIYTHGIINYDSRIDDLKDEAYAITYNPADNMFRIDSFRKSLLRFADDCGVELSEEDKDAGEEYQLILTLQMRAAMGLYD